MKPSQDLHTNIVIVRFSREGRLFSLCVTLNKAECFFIWQCSSVHMNYLGRNLLAHLICLILFPLAVGILKDHSCRHSIQ